MDEQEKLADLLKRINAASEHRISSRPEAIARLEMVDLILRQLRRAHSPDEDKERSANER